MVGWQAWLTEMQKWWDGLTASVREVVILASVLVAALVLGKIVGALVKAVSKGLGVDEVFKTPWSQTSLSRPSKNAVRRNRLPLCRNFVGRCGLVARSQIPTCGHC